MEVAVAGQPPEDAGQLRVSNRAAHCLIITTNVTQLLLLLVFLSLMLVTLDGAPLAWLVVFGPLWVSDVITVLTGVPEIIRLARPVSLEPVRRNLLIAQVNRLKGTLCTAVFKILVVRRLSDPLDTTPARVICIPFYVCALGRLILHSLKEKVPSPEPSSPPKRPGTPINPLHIFVLLVACRVDGLNELSWAATFWPTWIVLVLLAGACVASSFLGVGIFRAGGSPEGGQRALFTICYGVLLNVTVNGFAFQLNLVRRLDGDTSVSNLSIIAPLLVAYSGLLFFYLAFTFVLPRVVEHDLATMAERVEEDEQHDGVLEAVTSQLAPPFLVQQSSTLFQRVNTSMLHSFLTGGAPRAESAPFAISPEKGGERRAEAAEADLEATGGAPDVVPARGAPAAAEQGQEQGQLVLSEYEALQEELGLWLRSQKPQRLSTRSLSSLPDTNEEWRLVAVDAVTAAAAAAAAGAADAASEDANGAAAGAADAGSEDAPAHAAVAGAAAAEGEQQRRWVADVDGRRTAALDDGGGGGVGSPSARRVLAAELEEVEGVEMQPPSLPSSPPAAGSGPPPPVPSTGHALGSNARVLTRLSVRSEREAREGREGALRGEGPLSVPPEILRKLHRFVELKRQLAAQIVSATLLDLSELKGMDLRIDLSAQVQPAAAAPDPKALPGHGHVLPVASRRALPEADAEAQPQPQPTVHSRRSTGAPAPDPEPDPAPEPAPAPAADAASELEDDGELGESSCWICCEGPRDAVFLECGHGGLCLACARRCFKKKGRACPMCRQPITQVVHINPTQQAEYNGSRIVRVHESDPEILNGLASAALAVAAAASAD
ncbi:hypothetical protein T492DRAFT_904705 [Pavlovales sp. CCMP2436]|nr:hypothetical protein T492DRAFT_904705 [Pavlovales sp. CCMP2436]